MTKIVQNNPMEKMMIGFNIVADTLASTLGPLGTNVFIDDPMEPHSSNDGARISRNTQLEDRIENLGAGVVRNASNQTNDDAGDGTTTTAVLSQAIVTECLKRPEHPIVIEEQLKVSAVKVLKQLKSKAKKIGKGDIYKVAELAAEKKNKALAVLVTKIFHELGDRASVSVENNSLPEMSYETVDGYEAHVGFMKSEFVTDKKKMRAEYDDVPVLVSEKKISSVVDIAKIWKDFEVNKIGSCVIVCSDIDDSMLGVFVNSHKLNVFKCVVIRATGGLLEDIAASVGAIRISDQTGVTFQNFDIKKHMGTAKKVTSDANKTTFLASAKISESYAKQLENSASIEPNMYVKKKLLERVSKLRGGVAILKIGAHSDYERVYLKDKAEDTVKAVQAALEEGVVEGGGMTLWRIAQGIKPKTVGDEILKKALVVPLKTICANARKDYTEIVLNMPAGKGYDARRDIYVDLIEDGIIDPHKVERCALQNAVSSVGQFITNLKSITDYVKEEKRA